MRKSIIPTTLFLMLVLVACIKEDSPPAPTLTTSSTQSAPNENTADFDTPFTLKPGQSATIKQTNLTITFEGVKSDGRCPSAVDCVEDGPVIVVVSATLDESGPNQAESQTFTMNPDPQKAKLSGIPPNIVTFEDYDIELTAVEPYP
ncbi:MAG: hypothetical protein WAM60_23065, partial [Candidatus Promineifilaceae bacterium]